MIRGKFEKKQHIAKVSNEHVFLFVFNHFDKTFSNNLTRD